MIESAAKEKVDHVHRWFREIWREGREEVIDQLLPVHGTIHGLAPAPLVGPSQFKNFVRSTCRSPRSVSIEVGAIRASSLQATAELAVTTTHRRTGRSVIYRGAFLARFDKNGQITEAWFDAAPGTGARVDQGNRPEAAPHSPRP